MFRSRPDSDVTPARITAFNRRSPPSSRTRLRDRAASTMPSTIASLSAMVFIRHAGAIASSPTVLSATQCPRFGAFDDQILAGGRARRHRRFGRLRWRPDTQLTKTKRVRCARDRQPTHARPIVVRAAVFPLRSPHSPQARQVAVGHPHPIETSLTVHRLRAPAADGETALRSRRASSRTPVVLLVRSEATRRAGSASVRSNCPCCRS